MTKEEYNGLHPLMGVLLMTMMFGIFYFGMLDQHTMGIKCRFPAMFSKDKYCVSVEEDYGFSTWQRKSHKQDKIDSDNAEIQRIEREKRYKEEEIVRQKAQECYDAGNDYEINISIFEDYDLNCDKIAYINDHLIDSTRQEDGGYISGRYSGFLSSGSVKGEFKEYVTEGVLATGQLAKQLSYHLDCNGKQHNMNIKYYTESEFVMAYVDRCI